MNPALLVKCEEGALLCDVSQFSWYESLHRGSVQPSGVVSLDQSWEETQLVLKNLHGVGVGGLLQHTIGWDMKPLQRKLHPLPLII